MPANVVRETVSHRVHAPVWSGLRTAGMELAFSDLYGAQQEDAMFPMIRTRLDAFRLSRKLRKSLVTPDDKWKIDTDEEGRPTLSSGDFRLVLVPRAVRLFDAVHIYRDDVEIWLSLMARLR